MGASGQGEHWVDRNASIRIIRNVHTLRKNRRLALRFDHERNKGADRHVVCVRWDLGCKIIRSKCRQRTIIFARKPSSVDSTAIVALSVSMSKRTSPTDTFSPVL